MQWQILADMAPASKYRQNIAARVYSLEHFTTYTLDQTFSLLLLHSMNMQCFDRIYQIFRVQEGHQDGQVDDGTRELREEGSTAKPLEGGEGPAQLPDEGDD